MFSPEWSRSAHEALRSSQRRSSRWSIVIALALAALAFLFSPPYVPVPLQAEEPERIECVPADPIVIPPVPGGVVRPVVPSDFEIDPLADAAATLPPNAEPFPWVPPEPPRSPDFEAIPETRPVLIYQPVAEYPDWLRGSGAEGRVEVLLTVDENGRVVAAKIVSSSACAALEQAALKAATGCLFCAARQRDVPVPCRVLLPFEFVVD